jgi:hypothetical protein
MSAKFEVLSCANKDAARWQSLFDQLPPEYKDIIYSPKYALVQEALGQGSCFASVYLWDEYFVLQPFMLRGSELASYYGGGGPVTNHGPRLWLWFEQEFAKWREDNKITSEYVRLNPLLENEQRKVLREAPFQVECARNAVVINIDRTDDQLLASFSRNRRRGLASQEGQIEQSCDTDLFCRLYQDSMSRLQASEGWVYPNDAWSNYQSELGPEYVTFLKAADTMILLVHGFGKSYAHYIAGSGNHDLLYFAAMKHCRDLGAKIMLLGGGTTADADDPLLTYKKGFSKTVVPVLYYKRSFVEAGRTNDLNPVRLGTVWCG